MLRRRSQLWVFVAIIALAYVASSLTLGLLRGRAWNEVAWSALWGVLNSTTSVFIAMAVVPLLEKFTGITTDQTLLAAFSGQSDRSRIRLSAS